MSISLEDAEAELQIRKDQYVSALNERRYQDAANALLQKVFYRTVVVLLHDGLNVHLGDDMPEFPEANAGSWKGHKQARAKEVFDTLGLFRELMHHQNSMNPEDASGLLFVLGATLGDVYASFEAAATGASDRFDELQALENSLREQRKQAALAKAEAERIANAPARQRALEIARNARKIDPTLSQEGVADKIKDELKSLVPKNSSIEKWVRQWEQVGDLNKRNNRVP